MTDLNGSEPAFCTCFNLRKATRSVTQMFGAYMKPTGLGPTQFSLLAVLARKDALCINELADILVTDRTTLTRNLKPVEREGLIEMRCGEDRRKCIVALTPAGRRTFEEALPLWHKAQAEIIKRLGRKRWASLLSDLSAAVEVSRPS